VLATREVPEGNTDKPAEEEYARLQPIVEPFGATLQMLGNGALLAHIAGEPLDATRRAARAALAMKHVLPGWTIVVSSVRQDLDVVVDDGSALLTKAVIAAVVAPPTNPNAITLHVTAARHLGDEFDLEMGSPPKLLGPRVR
jgi:hypothetical protein